MRRNAAPKEHSGKKKGGRVDPYADPKGRLQQRSKRSQRWVKVAKRRGEKQACSNQERDKSRNVVEDQNEQSLKEIYYKDDYT